jgi:hypothetical protein
VLPFANSPIAKRWAVTPTAASPPHDPSLIKPAAGHFELCRRLARIRPSDPRDRFLGLDHRESSLIAYSEYVGAEAGSFRIAAARSLEQV